MIARQSIAAEAWTWRGTPFAHQHYLKGYACDCIGLVVGVALALKMPEAKAWLADREFRGYTPEPNVEKLRKAAAKYLDPIEPADSTLGDILLFSFRGDPMHFGIIAKIEPRKIIVHAYSLAGRVVDNGLEDRWQKRIVGAYAYRGIA